jgi:putative membrane protein
MAEKPDLRVYLAAERTLLAWIRTGLALMAFGFVVSRFGVVDVTRLSQWLGAALVLLGVTVTVASAAEYARILRRLDRGESATPARSRLGIALSLVLAALGLLMAVYLLVIELS